MSSVSTVIGVPSPFALGERLTVALRRLDPFVEEASEPRRDRRDHVPGDVLHQVDPMRPDVAGRPRRAGSRGLESPVPVVLPQ